MQIHSLKPKTARTTSPRIGRGGKRGKTSGRGNKGQKARSGHKMRPEIRDIIKKLPKLRGHGKNRARTVRTNRTHAVAVSLSVLENAYAAGDTVTPVLLVKKGIVSLRGGKVPQVKILATGSISKKLSISGCSVSKTARTAIEAAGGSIL